MGSDLRDLLIIYPPFSQIEGEVEVCLHGFYFKPFQAL